MPCDYSKCMKIVLYFLLLSHIPLALLDETISTKCLLNRTEVNHKIYSHYLNFETDIIIETSNRPFHQLITEIFKIFLEEVVGFQNVRVVKEQDNFDLEPIYDRLSPPQSEEAFPQTMINLEVWIPPDYDLKNQEQYQLITEFGSVAPPGRFGWFIPIELNKPVKRYYKSWQNNIYEVHWTFLRDRSLMERFDIQSEPEFEIIKQVFRQRPNGNCPPEICKNNIYTPPQCQNQKSCALLLAADYNSTKFVINHIIDLNLYTKVVWLGNNLKQVVQQLHLQYKNTDKSIIILHYTPSELIVRENRYVSIMFKQCNPLDDRHKTSIGCKYELNRLVKLSWNKIDTLGLLQPMRSFRFNEDDFDDLLTLYERNDANANASSISEVGCEWMRQHTETWQSTWSTGEGIGKKKIVIGGIFPITGSSYSGHGIVGGALLAREAINKDSNILAYYDLELHVNDGHCGADSVLKVFIDYIVQYYKDNLLGVLGPACSDTVEPLAGVSKYYHIPVISYSAEGAILSDRVKYPYFFRTIGENKHYIQVYLKMFKMLGWKRVASLTEDGQKYTEYISHMQEVLQENNITFIANTKFPREPETFQMSRYLEDLKRKSARIIICDVFDEIARIVMCEAYRLKMTSKEGYVWFLPTWLNSTWYNTDHFNKRNGSHHVNCTTAEMEQAIQGYFSISHAFFENDNKTIRGNMTVREWKEKYANMSANNKHFKSSNYAGYAYDAVWAYALAFDKLIKADPKAASDLHSLNTTNKLVQLIQDIDFQGVSGRIKFYGGPSRFSTINIIQWSKENSTTIGYFVPTLAENLTGIAPEKLNGTLELNLSLVKWFTKDRKIPSDGTLPPSVCAFESLAKALNITCEQAIVVLNVILVTILLIIVVGAIYFMKKRYDQKVNATKEYMRHFGIDLILNSTTINDLDKWEIARNSVVINRKLGEGAFGTVYGGEAELPEKGWMAVAVKTLKVGSSTEDKLDFLSEAEVMKRFEHKNIVKLLGVCTKEEPIYTIMEFMLYGDLKTFLLARRHLVNKRNSVEEVDEISSRKLTSMALDVARGLSYLAELKYVHRDVASRNCLINAQRVVKLGDFGMTRAMFENDYYKFTRKGMLPVRWMSPESLALGVFTPASDVWGYGVLLYEIITFGSFPYQGLSNNDVLEYVKNGNTISIPQGVKPQLHGLLKSCWDPDPKQRTRASEIVEFLANNPRLLTPCLDLPLASVHLDDPEQMEFNLPDSFRKCSTTSNLECLPITQSSSTSQPHQPQLNGVVETSTSSRRQSYNSLLDNGTTGDNIPLENYCPKEPLLGPAKSNSSLLKYVSLTHDQKDLGNDDDYLPHSSSNGYVISKV